MIVNPILSIYLMSLFCVILIYIVFKKLNQKLYSKILKTIIVIILFMINLRVMIFDEKIEVNSKKSNIDVVFVIDNTLSMQAKDDNENRRLDLAKNTIEKIVDLLEGANFSVITFDNQSKIYIPFTQDNSIVKSAVNVILPIPEYSSNESSLNIPIDDLEYLLTYNAEDEKEKIVFYLSDGEITNGSDLDNFSNLSKYISNGAVIGYGSNLGSKIEMLDYNNQPYYLQDYTTLSDAITFFDEENLKKLSLDLGIRYFYESNSEIDEVIEEIKKLKQENDGQDYIEIYKDTYQYLACVLLFLIFVDFIIFKFKVSKETI